MIAAAFEVDAAFTIGAETFPVFTVFRPVVFMGKSYTACSNVDARNWPRKSARFHRHSGNKSALFGVQPEHDFRASISGIPECFTFLLELINDCD